MVTVRAFFMPEPKPRTKTKNDMKHFTERELRCRCCGQLPPQARDNIEALVDNVLDPAREAFGGPIYVNSGYRCPRHNAEVGGVARSQHLVGEAADVRPGANENQNEKLARLAKIIVENGRVDQMIIYPTFIHVSWKRVGSNRHRIITR